jgi:hypothetical protein
MIHSSTRFWTAPNVRSLDIEDEEEQIGHDARVHMHRLHPEPFVTPQAWLDQVQAFWADQLGAFKAHVERTQKGERT